MRIGVLCLTDDPFDPAGYGRHGGSHRVMFDMGRHFVRRGATVIYVTRLNSPHKPAFEELGTRCSIHRVASGPTEPMPYYECAAFLDDMTRAVSELAAMRSPPPERVVSYNWLSGEVAARLYAQETAHTHYVLTLGRAKLETGEPRDKVTDAWLACEERVFAHARRIVTCSTYEREALKRLYPAVDPRKIFCIPLGVDLNVFGRRPRSTDHLVRRAADRFSEGADHAG